MNSRGDLDEDVRAARHAMQTPAFQLLTPTQVYERRTCSPWPMTPLGTAPWVKDARLYHATCTRMGITISLTTAANTPHTYQTAHHICHQNQPNQASHHPRGRAARSGPPLRALLGRARWPMIGAIKDQLPPKAT
jgi:hypothetical protein